MKTNIKTTESEAVYCNRIRCALRARGILGAEHGPNASPRSFEECEELLKAMYPQVYKAIRASYTPEVTNPIKTKTNQDENKK